MHRIDGPGSVNGHWDPGDPASNRLPTQVTHEWMEDLQQNVCHVIEFAGITLEKGVETQLKDAIVAIVAALGGGGGGGGEGGPYLLLAGGLMGGFITLHAPPTQTMHAANKGYVDAAVDALAGALPDFDDFLLKSGGTMSGYIVLHQDPTLPLHPVTLQYLVNALEAVTSPFTDKFRSADLAINFGNQIISAAHGLDGVPNLAEAWLKCINAEGGYSAGDHVPISALYRNQNAIGSYGETPRQAEAGSIMFKSATHVGVRIFSGIDVPETGVSSEFMLPHKTQQSYFEPSSSKWKVVLEACL